MVCRGGRFAPHGGVEPHPKLVGNADASDTEMVGEIGREAAG